MKYHTKGLIKSIRKGELSAYMELADCYAMGKGIEKDYMAAYCYLLQGYSLKGQRFQTAYLNEEANPAFYASVQLISSGHTKYFSKEKLNEWKRTEAPELLLYEMKAAVENKKYDQADKLFEQAKKKKVHLAYWLQAESYRKRYKGNNLESHLKDLAYEYPYFYNDIAADYIYKEDRIMQIKGIDYLLEAEKVGMLKTTHATRLIDLLQERLDNGREKVSQEEIDRMKAFSTKYRKTNQ